MLGAIVTGCALAFGSASLYVPGLALLVVGVGSAAWVSASARGASLARRLGPPTVQENERYPIEIDMRAGLLPPPGGALIEPLLQRPLAVAGRRARRVRVDVTFERRGRRVLEPCRLLLHDPLRLAERELVTAGGQVLVLPRIEPIEPMEERGWGAGADGAAARVGLAAELEIDSLRPYRPGAPASRIHWPTVARTGAMMERRLVAEADSWPLVVLDPCGAAGDEDLDRAVRAAASLCVHLARRGGCALMLPGDRRPVEVGPDLRAWPALHVRLALVEAAAGAPAPGRLQRSAAVFWVAAGRGRRPPASLGAGGGYLLTPASNGARGARRGAFAVAGMTAQRLRGKGRAAA